jgi:SAM-dependent methyltransferase
MDIHTDVKQLVKDKYGEIAKRSSPSEGGCCGSCEHDVGMTEDYAALAGYEPAADLGLGCGIPTDIADLAAGETVLDLGSGAGNDVFVARSLVGDQGRVIGVDMTPAMIERAETNRIKLGYANVEFRLGDIEHLPVASSSIDVVVSNCVLNLVPDKATAFSEIYRVLKPGGRFAISDIVTRGELPVKIRTAAELYVGCVSGAMTKDRYLKIIKDAGFDSVNVRKERVISLPDAVLARYLTAEEIAGLRAARVAILSLTVRAEKPAGAHG